MPSSLRPAFDPGNYSLTALHFPLGRLSPAGKGAVRSMVDLLLLLTQAFPPSAPEGGEGASPPPSIGSSGPEPDEQGGGRFATPSSRRYSALTVDG